MERMIRACREREAQLIALRRELHKVPEIGGQLPKTRQIVCEHLNEIGIPYVKCTVDDGVVAEIKGAHPGKTVAFRADMDALHIHEDNDLPFKSQIEGQMHGCGHDAHTAILLTAAEIINNRRDELRGTVRLIFQTGEGNRHRCQKYDRKRRSGGRGRHLCTACGQYCRR